MHETAEQVSQLVTRRGEGEWDQDRMPGCVWLHYPVSALGLTAGHGLGCDSATVSTVGWTRQVLGGVVPPIVGCGHAEIVFVCNERRQVRS